MMQEKKQPLNNSSVDKNIRLMREVNKVKPDWFKAERKATVTVLTSDHSVLW